MELDSFGEMAIQSIFDERRPDHHKLLNYCVCVCVCSGYSRAKREPAEGGRVWLFCFSFTFCNVGVSLFSLFFFFGHVGGGRLPFGNGNETMAAVRWMAARPKPKEWRPCQRWTCSITTSNATRYPFPIPSFLEIYRSADSLNPRGHGRRGSLSEPCAKRLAIHFSFPFPSKKKQTNQQTNKRTQITASRSGARVAVASRMQEGKKK